jgi:hypothetical protein
MASDSVPTAIKQALVRWVAEQFVTSSKSIDQSVKRLTEGPVTVEYNATTSQTGFSGLPTYVEEEVRQFRTIIQDDECVRETLDGLIQHSQPEIEKRPNPPANKDQTMPEELTELSARARLNQYIPGSLGVVVLDHARDAKVSISERRLMQKWV